MNEFLDRFVFASLLALLITVSCDWLCDDDCEAAKSETRSLRGQPEEIDKYSTSGYHYEGWWYWSQGYEKSFTWGSSVSGCCDTSEYTFTPIGGPALDTLNNVTAAEAFAQGIAAYWAQANGSFSLILDGALHLPMSSNVYLDYVRCREDVENFSRLDEERKSIAVSLLAEAALRLSKLEE
jgi:hypothetical protein